MSEAPSALLLRRVDVARYILRRELGVGLFQVALPDPALNVATLILDVVVSCRFAVGFLDLDGLGGVKVGLPIFQRLVSLLDQLRIRVDVTTLDVVGSLFVQNMDAGENCSRLGFGVYG